MNYQSFSSPFNSGGEASCPEGKDITAFHLVPDINTQFLALRGMEAMQELQQARLGSVSKTPCYVGLAAALGSLPSPKSLEIMQEGEED